MENISWPNLKQSECLPCLSPILRRWPMSRSPPLTTISTYLVVITVFIVLKLNKMRGYVYHSYQVTNPSSSSTLLFSIPEIASPKRFPLTLWQCLTPGLSCYHCSQCEAREEHPEITTACWKCQLSLIFWTRLQFTYEHIASPEYLDVNKGGDQLVFPKSAPHPRRL